jgi:hypothetical protein
MACTVLKVSPSDESGLNVPSKLLLPKINAGVCKRLNRLPSAFAVALVLHEQDTAGLC